MKLINISSIILITLVLTGKKAICCTFSNHSGDLRVANINGGEIYTLFTPHLLGFHTAMVSCVLTDECKDYVGSESINKIDTSDPNKKDSILDGLNLLLRKYRNKIQSEKSDVSQITNLAKSGQIRWIGIEATPEEIQSGIKIEVQVRDYLKMKELLNKHFTPNNKRIFLRKWNKEKTDQILHLMYNPHIIARAENPHTFRTIPIIPIDDENATKEGDIHLSRRTQSINNLRKLYKQLCMNKAPRPSWCSPLTAFCFITEKICEEIRKSSK